jgi:hypothetical protein
LAREEGRLVGAFGPQDDNLAIAIVLAEAAFEGHGANYFKVTRERPSSLWRAAILYDRYFVTLIDRIR